MVLIKLMKFFNYITVVNQEYYGMEAHVLVFQAGLDMKPAAFKELIV